MNLQEENRKLRKVIRTLRDALRIARNEIRELKKEARMAHNAFQEQFNKLDRNST